MSAPAPHVAAVALPYAPFEYAANVSIGRRTFQLRLDRHGRVLDSTLVTVKEVMPLDSRG